MIGQSQAMELGWLAEDPLLIWLLGALFLTAALVVYFQLRTRQALSAVIGVILVTALLLVGEQLWVTPREAVVATLYDMADAIEVNDTPATLAFADPAAADLRADIQALMPQWKFARANIISPPEVTLNLSSQPRRATATFRAIVQVANAQTSLSAPYSDDLTVELVELNGRWLVTDYATSRDVQRFMR